jgi:hypothetical protein
MKINIFFIISLFLFLCTCEKEDFLWTLKPLIPKISSIQKPELCNNILSVSAKIDHNGGSKILEKGFCYSTTKNPTKDNNPVKIEDENELMLANLSLKPNLVYYIRAFATNKVGTSYGKEEEIKTPSSFIALLTNNATNILNKTAKITGKIINNGSSITESGFYLSLEPDKSGTKIVSNPNINGDFFLDLTNLISGRTYYYFAFANLGRCIIEGEKKSFTTSSTFCPPNLKTETATSITQNSAIINGSIISDGGFPIGERGFAWGTTPSPNINQNNKAVSGLGTSFSVTINNLSQNTRYYYRAFVINSCGITYSSNEETFLTINCSLPISTLTPTNITYNSARVGGTISTAVALPIKKRGVVWDTRSSPDISLVTKKEQTPITGTFNTEITDLKTNTRYFYRAYATNECDTYYGKEEIFTTLSCSPVLNTQPISNITFNSATSGGIVTNDNGFSITNRGLVWDTKPAPDIKFLNTKSSNGSGIGYFTGNLTNLKSNTKYFYRAYATNNCETSYGNELSFTTLNCLLLTTSPATNINSSSALSGGNITNTSSPVILRGVVWDTKPAPDIELLNTKNSIGPGGIGPFTINLTNLSPNTKYFYRSYAINNCETSYGNEFSFTTASNTLGKPSLINPINNSVVNCCVYSLSWSCVTNAKSYDIQISTDINFANSIRRNLVCRGYFGSGLSKLDLVEILDEPSSCVDGKERTCHLQPGGSGDNATYFWRVRAKNGTIVGPWSTSGKFVFIW